MHTMMTRSVLALTIRVKMAKNLGKTLGENISSSLKMENSCNFCPNQPNLMIFVAKIINSYMLIRFMRTTMLLVQILMVKMMKNHEKCLGESISGSLD